MSISKSVIIMLAAMLFVACSRMESSREQEVFASNDDAKKLIDFPLVNSATNVFFYECVGGLQSLDRFVRLTVSTSDVTNQVNMIITDNNHKFNRELPYTKTNIISSEITRPFDKKVKLNWWTPEKVTNGYYVGGKESYSVKIWVDESNGTLFIHQGD
ncbi:MAG: hypothetical protein WAO02_10845 [Verrucomicrobiia bacterium]